MKRGGVPLSIILLALLLSPISHADDLRCNGGHLRVAKCNTRSESPNFPLKEILICEHDSDKFSMQIRAVANGAERIGPAMPVQERRIGDSQMVFLEKNSGTALKLSPDRLSGLVLYCGKQAVSVTAQEPCNPKPVQCD